MAITYCILASGSSGNCLWVRGGGVQLLVDCGISARRIGRHLHELGADLQDVQGVVCTHGHDDHVSGARVLVRRHDLAIWATAGARGVLGNAVPEERLRALPKEGSAAIGGLTVSTLPTPHDSPDSVALVISDGDTSLGIVTDLGTPTPAIAKAMSTVDGLVLEFNHDEQMLADGPYPVWLKRRVKGNFGHLSNVQGAALLQQIGGASLQHLTLAHLSEHNNTPELARREAEAMCSKLGLGVKLAIGEHRQPGTPVELRMPQGAPRKARQLALF